jgi:hypothetical protein
MRVISLTGLATSALSSVLGIAFLVERLRHRDTPPGWASVVVPFLFLGGIQTVARGIIGEYAGKYYLDKNGTPQ